MIAYSPKNDMYLKKRALYIILIPILVGFKSISTNDLDVFLSKKALRVDSIEVINNINRFLNYQVEKGAPVWFKGSLTTTDEESFKDLALNFNVLDNSLYLLYDSDIYRVSNFAIKDFEIEQKGELLKFRKGYAETFGAKIAARFNGTSQELLSFLSSYPEFNDLQIKNLSMSESQKTEIKIELRTGSRDQISGLKRFLDSNEKIQDSESHFNVSELGVSKYFQVLFEHESFDVLKYNFKRSATAESVSLVKHSASSFMFNDEDYYIADSNKQLQEFLFTKKSIEKVLTSMDITSAKKIKNIGNEKKVIDWFNNNTFN